jgi:coenzyme F420-reducing hydrogenase gamma subunit
LVSRVRNSRPCCAVGTCCSAGSVTRLSAGSRQHAAVGHSRIPRTS